MIEIVTAKTVDEAKARAAQIFGVDVERITFTVLEEPRKGLFGMKGEAKLQAEYEKTKSEIACDYISAVMQAMGFDKPEINVSENDDGGYVFDLGGEGTDGIIGRRGETIDALQYLTSLACNKHDKDYSRITLDCDNFRERRKGQLEDLAAKMAAKVKKTGRTVALEPMNPYERRIIHAAIADIEGCSSRSVGEDPYRKVLISSTEKKPYNSSRGDRDNRDRRGQRRGDDNRGGERRQGKRRDDFKARSLDITSSFEKDYKKPKPEDEIGSGLYSKIEF